MHLILDSVCYPHVTIGRLIADGQQLCWILEDPWNDNKPNVSCIPEGFYMLKPTVSPKFGETYYLDSGDGVVGLDKGERTHILLHSGNTTDDTTGCLIPGSELGVIGSKWAVLNSRYAQNELMEKLEGFTHELEIIRS